VWQYTLAMKSTTHQRAKNLIPSSSALLRWGGAGAVLGGILFLAWGYVHKNAALPPYFDAIAAMLHFIVPLLFLVGLTGLYLRHRRQAGWLGELGFILCFFGSVWGVLDAVVPTGPWIAYMISERGLPGVLVWWTGWTLPLITGLTLIGTDTIATVEASQRWDSLPLIMGLFGWAYYVTDDYKMLALHPAHVAFGVMFGLSWVVLGYALLSEKMNRPNYPARKQSFREYSEGYND
jgi:hypothetical protein